MSPPDLPARIPLGLALVLACCPLLPAQDGAPLVPGLHGNHGLESAQLGRVLLQELRCAACHADERIEAPPAPDLETAGARIAPDFLRTFLACCRFCRLC